MTMAQRICKDCGYVGGGKTITKGSILIELVLWCFLIIPGLIYSIWRHTSRYEGCPKCGGQALIPLDSPIGKKLSAEMKQAA